LSNSIAFGSTTISNAGAGVALAGLAGLAAFAGSAADALVANPGPAAAHITAKINVAFLFIDALPLTWTSASVAAATVARRFGA
jgi:hypothetical protein